MHPLEIGLKSTSIVLTFVKWLGVVPIFGIIRPSPYESLIGVVPMTVSMNACTKSPTEKYRVEERFNSITANGHFGVWQECRNLRPWHFRY